MELFHKINELRLAAFKAGDKFLHSVLTNVFSDVAPVGTEAAAGVVPTDDQVQAVVKKHLDGVTDTLKAIAGKADQDVIALKEKEKAILEGLRPSQLDAAALAAVHDEVQPDTLKGWMAHLKAHFTHRYDGKVAKTVFETAQSEAAAAVENQGNYSSTDPVAVEGNVVAPVANDSSAPGAEPSVPNSPAVEIDDAAPSSTEPVVAPVVIEAPVGDTFQAPVAAEVVQEAPAAEVTQ
jgi:uncharacterized protein YqeY